MEIERSKNSHDKELISMRRELETLRPEYEY